MALAGGMLPLNGSAPMTGPLSLSGNATQPLHAVPLQQLTAATAGGPFLPLATGGTVTGATVFSGSGRALDVLTGTARFQVPGVSGAGATVLTGNTAAAPPNIAGTMLQLVAADNYTPRFLMDATNGNWPFLAMRVAAGPASAPTALINGSKFAASAVFRPRRDWLYGDRKSRRACDRRRELECDQHADAVCLVYDAGWQHGSGGGTAAE